MPDTSNTAEPGKPRRRWFHFSLRSMLIGVALLAMVAWFAAEKARLMQERDEAIERARQAEEREGQAKTDLSIYKYGRLPWPEGP